MIKIILDFDGTIVNVWKRYYSIFKDGTNLNISFEKYKSLKKELERDELIIKTFKNNVSEDFLENYFKFKKRNLENKKYLELDSLILNPNLVKKNNFEITILTLRRNKENFLWQINKLALNPFFEDFVVLKPKQAAKKNWFEIHLRKNIYDFVYIVGDSEEDALLSLFPNTRLFIVKTGLRKPENIIYKNSLYEKENITVIENINEFFKNLWKQKYS